MHVADPTTPDLPSFGDANVPATDGRGPKRVSLSLRLPAARSSAHLLPTAATAPRETVCARSVSGEDRRALSLAQPFIVNRLQLEAKPNALDLVEGVPKGGDRYRVEAHLW